MRYSNNFVLSDDDAKKDDGDAKKDSDEEKETKDSGDNNPDKEPNFAANSVSSIIDLMEIIEPAVKYDGFNPKVIRDTFIDKYENDEDCSRDLLISFTAYSTIGNNISKLNNKRNNPKVAKMVMEYIQSIGISKKAADKNALTLPRIAIAFMPEYLVYRKYIARGLQNQTSSPINVIYKDIVFLGNNQIRAMDGYIDFHKEFSSYIIQPGTDVALDDKVFLAKYNRWNKVVISGYATDTDIHARMGVAISTTGGTPMQALQFIMEGIDYYGHL